MPAQRAPFASQLMMQILAAGLQMAAPLRPLENAHTGMENCATIPLHTKRQWVENVAEKYGFSTLLALGRGAAQFTHTPIAMALLTNASPEQVLFRWQRLERYAHSNHYCDIEYKVESGENDLGCQALIQHSARNNAAPSLAEDLAVLGVICTLLHLRGAQALQVYCEHQLAFDYQEPVPKQGSRATRAALFEHLTKVPKRQWLVRWRSDDSQPLPGQHLACNALANALNNTWQTKTKLAIKNIGLLDTSLTKVAIYLGVSDRSLQRFLASESTGFAKLLQQVRIENASTLLLSNRQTLAEIGFTCGFSDQAHFTRQFKQLNGMPPKAFSNLYLGAT